LSPRERDLITGGLTTRRSPAGLGLSTKAVGNHISAIFAKLQVAGRAEVIIRSRDAAGLDR